MGFSTEIKMILRAKTAAKNDSSHRIIEATNVDVLSGNGVRNGVYLVVLQQQLLYYHRSCIQHDNEGKYKNVRAPYIRDDKWISPLSFSIGTMELRHTTTYPQRDTTTQRLHTLPPTTPHNTNVDHWGKDWVKWVSPRLYSRI